MKKIIAALAALFVSVSLVGQVTTTPWTSPKKNWDGPWVWTGNVPPVAGDDVMILPGQVINLTSTTVPLGHLDIYGTLQADSLFNFHLIADSITIHMGGAIKIGAEDNPYAMNASITLTGGTSAHAPRTQDNGLSNDGVSRGIRCMGLLSLYGATPGLTKTKLNAHTQDGATSFTLADNVNWKEGDTIAISTTDFYGVQDTEILTLAANSVGNQITTTAPCVKGRWGLLQYPTDTGMSLTPRQFSKTSDLTPTVLDERAEVVNLSRNIVIQGADDADWANDGFGAHVMIMGDMSQALISGVELRRVGQRQAVGRYPIHWHMRSWSGSTFTGNVSNDFMVESSVWDSQNRAVTIHGTCGVFLGNVYAVDIKGHAFFLEDGSEQDNVIIGCVAMKVRDPGSAYRIKTNDQRASGFWLTNPDNIVTHNSASDCEGVGLWNSFANQCFGESSQVPLEPRLIVINKFDDNTGHGCGRQGIMTDDIVVNEAGDTVTQRYLERWNNTQEYVFYMWRNIIWKNNTNGYQNRVMSAQYMGWTGADNNGKDFTGSTFWGYMEGTLLVGASLNNATAFTNPIRQALGSYHYRLDTVSISAINYPYQPPIMVNGGQFVQGGGVIDGSDNYTSGIGLGGIRNPGWHLVNSFPGFLTPPPYFDGFPIQAPNGSQRHWSTDGAIWDPYGYWAAQGGYLVVDDPFYTYELTDAVSLFPEVGFVGTMQTFYGIRQITVDNHPASGRNTLITLRAARLDAGLQEVGHNLIGDPALTTWLPNMRHFAFAKDGTYAIQFPTIPAPSDKIQIGLSNAYRADDGFLVSIPWDGNTPVNARIESGSGVNLNTGVAQGRLRFLVNGASLSDVQNDPTGVTMWQDTANDVVWVKYVGGLTWYVSPWGNQSPQADANIDREQTLILEK
jgi:hypothetical protein